MSISRLLIIVGVIFIAAGLLWPWLQRSGLGRLPGDIVVERDNMKLYFPLTTSLIISLVLSVLYWIFRK